MTHVGISALRDHLGKYLHLARGGEKVVVTDQGRPVAVLTGIEEDQEIRQAWDLVDAGLADWNGAKPMGSKKPVKLRGGGKSAAEIVIQDRR